MSSDPQLIPGQQINVRNGYGAPDTQATVLVAQRPASPKVSVIMPVYNGGKYLRECLDSVAGQTLQDMEIICVDDGSTDSSLEILKEYAAKDGRFTILSQQNHFAGVARNAGLAIACGEYLSFLDSDDVFEPRMLEDAYAAAVRDDSDVVIFGYRCCSEDLEEEIYRISIPGDLLAKSPIHPLDAGEKAFHIVPPNAWSKLFRHSLVRERQVTFATTRSTNDMTFVSTMCALAGKISLLDGCYITYRGTRAGNITSARGKNFQAYLDALTALRDNLKHYGVYRRMKAAFRYIATSSCFYELRFCGATEERERKLAEFGKAVGGAVADRVRARSSAGLRRRFFRLRSMFRGVIGRD